MNSFKLRIVLAISIMCSTAAILLVDGTQMNEVYRGLRMLGHFAFPIATFLLVEGYFHTADKKKYFLRLFTFGLVAEFPYLLVNLKVLNVVNDALVKNLGSGVKLTTDNLKLLGEKLSDDAFIYYYDLLRVSGFYAINGLLTLAFAFLMIWAIDKCKQKYIDNKRGVMFAIVTTFIILGFVAVMIFFPFDSAVEILLFAAMFYYMRGNKPGISIMTTLLIINFFIKIDILYACGVMLGVIILFTYNGQPGDKRFKWVFYAAYPVQFILFYLISSSI